MAGPTLSDIARMVGLSKNAVSLALRSDPQIPERTRQRVREAADRLGYRSNALVSQLMTQLRASRTTRWQAKLALLNAHRDPEALRNHPTLPTSVSGCEARAEKLGYSFDRFWMHDPSMTAASWLRILQARSIRGIVIVGLMDTARLPAALLPVWRALPTVVTGVRTRDPALSFCSVDHHALTVMAFEKALQLGYRRPALVLDNGIDDLVERRFSAGFLAAQHRSARSRHIPIFQAFGDADLTAPRPFWPWMRRHKPDVLFTLYNRVVSWVEDAGWKIPGDIGVIQLEWRGSRPRIAGMNQHNELTGAAAVDMVVSQINNGEVGVQEFPRATLIGASWVEGPSVRARPAAEPS